MPTSLRSVAARAYAARINKIFGGSRSAAALLLNTQSVELVIEIDAAHDHSTLSALQLGRTVEVVSVRRPKAREPLLDITQTSVKVQQGDQLTLRGAAHVLAGVAIQKGGKLVLAPRLTRAKLAPQIRGERAALLAAADALHKRLLPLMRARAAEGRARRIECNAASKLQALVRGRSVRGTHAGLIEAHRARVRAARLRSRKLLVSMLRAQHNGPICPAACFTKPTAEALEASAVSRAEWAAQPANAAKVLRFTHMASMSRSHVGALGRYMGAAPESRKLRPLPWSALRLLQRQPVELTTTIDKRANNGTVGSLQLPRSVAVVGMRINGRQMAPPKNATQLQMQKLLDGDQLTLRGLPHRLAAVCEVKGGKFAPLVLVPPKARKAAVGVRLRRERLWLLALAERLARRLQELVRERLSLRAQHRQSHAALVIQIEWAQVIASRLSARQLNPHSHSTANAELSISPQLAASEAVAATPRPLQLSTPSMPEASESVQKPSAVAHSNPCGMLDSGPVRHTSTSELSPTVASVVASSATSPDRSEEIADLPTGADDEETVADAVREELLAEVFGRRSRSPAKGSPAKATPSGVADGTAGTRSGVDDADAKHSIVFNAATLSAAPPPIDV